MSIYYGRQLVSGSPNLSCQAEHWGRELSSQIDNLTRSYPYDILVLSVLGDKNDTSEPVGVDNDFYILNIKRVLNVTSDTLSIIFDENTSVLNHDVIDTLSNINGIRFSKDTKFKAHQPNAAVVPVYNITLAMMT